MVSALAFTRHRYYPHIILGIAVTTAAGGLIFIRLAQNEGIPSLVIIAFRFIIAMSVLTPLALRQQHTQPFASVTRRDARMLILAGVLFSGDILAFTEAIRHTSILLAALIGGLLPLWTALLERLILRTAISRAVYIGLALAITGGTVIALSSGSSLNMGPNPVLGAVLATISSWSAAGYLIVARSLRPRLPLVPYLWVVFGIAMLVVLVVTLVTNTRMLSYPLAGYLWIVLVTVSNQLIAHPGFNIAIAYFSPTFISIMAQSITVISAALAFLVFNEVPSLGEFVGSAIILSGVVFAIIGQNRPS